MTRVGARRWSLLGVASLCSACAHGAPAASIPPGTYADPANEQFVVVQESAVAFELRVREGDEVRRLSRRYASHRIAADGRIRLHPMLAADYLGRYEWRWDGTRILREGRGRPLAFTRRAIDD